MDVYVADAVPEEVPFELVVFKRTANAVTVVVRGMSVHARVEAVCYETARKTSISVVGSMPGARVRPFELCETVQVERGRVVSVHGLGGIESLIGSLLPEDLPVVCGPDPMLAGLTNDFLHKRGDRYVLMTAPAMAIAGEAAKVA